MAAGDRPEEGCAGETGISDELRGRLIFIRDREYGTYRAFDAGDGDGDGGIRSAEGVRRRWLDEGGPRAEEEQSAGCGMEKVHA